MSGSIDDFLCHVIYCTVHTQQFVSVCVILKFFKYLTFILQGRAKWIESDCKNFILLQMIFYFK